MRRPGRRLTAATVVLTIGALGQLAGPAVVQADLGSGTTTTGASTETVQTGTRTVTLVTGDRVVYRPGPSGATVLAARPGPDRHGMVFRTMRLGRQQLVIPLDALPLVAAGRVDRRLFDIDVLAKSALDDTTPELPLLIERTSGAAKALTTGTKVVRDLPVVNAVAVRQQRRTAGELWQRWTAHGLLAAGIKRIWLDGGISVSLDRSVAQIGAPEAWRAGATGKGVKVAVLDTGYDATHPDLAQVAGGKDFTEDGDLVDRNGHGTHVASTIVGSGAASGGRYKGVAPDADLIVGKVCDQRGQCALSSIIAGMQWAAAQGARVVSMSLGGEPTDGTDPMAQAVDELTASTGTLFVVAAGNFGAFGEQTVGTPASADAALAVASVTKGDTLSPFSSRGPRFGDLGLKPDIAAPGSRIVAARAAGTLAPLAVNASYAELSGTSMATPHVAGAAAIVAQLHPDWNADRLRAALTGSAELLDDIGVFSQGAGRVNVARAIRQQVTSLPSAVDLGTASYPHDDDTPLTKAIAYRNDGDRAVTLRLRLRVSGPGGRPAPFVRLDTGTLTIPAHSTASTTVTANTRGDAVDGVYGGWLVAEGGGATVLTAVGLNVEVPSYSVDITMFDREGQPAAAGGRDGTVAVVQATDTATGQIVSADVADGSAKLRLRRGTYVLEGLQGIPNEVGDGYREIAYAGEPSQQVDHDTKIVIDGRQAKQVRTVAPAAGLSLAMASIGFERPVGTGTLVSGMAVISSLQPGTPPPRIYVVPNRTGTSREFTGFGHAAWAVRPPDQKPDRDFYLDSPSVYNDVARWPGRFPQRPELATPARDYSRVDATYPTAVLSTRANRYAIPVLTAADGREFGGTVIAPSVEMRLPFHRAEYYAVPKGARWTSDFLTFRYTDESSGEIQEDSIIRGPTTAYLAGRSYAERWGGAVFGPNLRSPAVGAPWNRSGLPWVFRDGDSLTVNAPMFGDSGPGRVGDAAIESEHTTLDRDGVQIAASDSLIQQTFTLPASPGEYTLTKQISRATDRYPLSSSITAAWTFHSVRTVDGTAEALPLLSVRYEPTLDDHDHAPAGHFSLPVEVLPQAGSSAGPVRKVTVEVSYDDGRTWQRALVRRVGRGWSAALEHPASGFVSLRTRAEDRAGNQIVLTTIRAYALGR